MATETKVELLRDVTVPQKGSFEVVLYEAGKTITVAAEVAERFIRIGAAKKAK